MLRMQTLGISDSTPRSESRLRSLFWPSIRSAFDVEYLAVQGYWVCSIVAILSLILLGVGGHSLTGLIVFLFLYFGGVGVREHNRFAATVVFIYYAIDTVSSLKVLVGSPGGLVIRVVILALLLSNLRATWIAANWKTGSEEAALPDRLGETWSDRFANTWPARVWPKIKMVYYIFAVALCLLFAAGLVMTMGRISME